jgi:hypothetical protein
MAPFPTRIYKLSALGVPNFAFFIQTLTLDLLVAGTGRKHQSSLSCFVGGRGRDWRQGLLLPDQARAGQGILILSLSVPSFSFALPGCTEPKIILAFSFSRVQFPRRRFILSLTPG